MIRRNIHAVWRLSPQGVAALAKSVAALCLMGIAVMALTAPAAADRGDEGGETGVDLETITEDPAAKDEPPTLPQPRAWQYDPYRIHAWIAADEAGGLGSPLIDRVARGIRERSPIAAGATWKADGSAPPSESVRIDMLRSLERIESSELFEMFESSDEIRNLFNAHDKIMLIAIRSLPLGFEIVCRELDVVTRQLGLPFRRVTRQRDMIERHAFGAVADSFRAIVKIDDVKNKDIRGLVRAGGLVLRDENPSRVAAGGVMIPIVRANDRLGQPRELNGIRLAEWSFLLVNQLENSRVTCRLHTGLLNPLGGRAGSRIQKFGLQIRPRDARTTIQFLSKLEKNEPPENQTPLAGYEIRDRHPSDKNESRPMGQTDWNGEVEIPQGPTPLRLVFVRSGGMLLASFPTVPGYHPHLIAEMTSDEGRLRAEAFIRGVQRNIMDTVAKRKVLIKKVDKLLKEKKVAEAEPLVAQFRALVMVTEMNALLDRNKSAMPAGSRRKQAMIDQMFADTRELVSTYLGDKELVELESKLSKAKGGG